MKVLEDSPLSKTPQRSSWHASALSLSMRRTFLYRLASVLVCRGDKQMSLTPDWELTTVQSIDASEVQLCELSLIGVTCWNVGEGLFISTEMTQRQLNFQSSLKYGWQLMKFGNPESVGWRVSFPSIFFSEAQLFWECSEAVLTSYLCLREGGA